MQFPELFPSLRVVRVVVGTGAASVPFRSDALSPPEVRVSSPSGTTTATIATTYLSKDQCEYRGGKIFGQRISITKMAHARRSRIRWKNSGDVQPTADRATDFTSSTCLLQSTTRSIHQSSKSHALIRQLSSSLNTQGKCSTVSQTTQQPRDFSPPRALVHSPKLSILHIGVEATKMPPCRTVVCSRISCLAFQRRARGHSSHLSSQGKMDLQPSCIPLSGCRA